MTIKIKINVDWIQHQSEGHIHLPGCLNGLTCGCFLINASSIWPGGRNPEEEKYVKQMVQFWALFFDVMCGSVAFLGTQRNYTQYVYACSGISGHRSVWIGRAKMCNGKPYDDALKSVCAHVFVRRRWIAFANFVKSIWKSLSFHGFLFFVAPFIMFAGARCVCPLWPRVADYV